jgi:hypothetical protein
MELQLQDRKKLTQVTAKTYQKAKKLMKSTILDTFIDQTGYERKYAIHLLVNEGRTPFIGNKLKAQASRKSRKKLVYVTMYDDVIREALVPIWLAFNCLSGKILVPFLHACRVLPTIRHDPNRPGKTLTHQRRHDRPPVAHDQAATAHQGNRRHTVCPQHPSRTSSLS